MAQLATTAVETKEEEKPASVAPPATVEEYAALAASLTPEELAMTATARARVDETSRRDDDARAGSTTAREGIVDAAVSRRGIADARANARTIDSE